MFKRSTRLDFSDQWILSVSPKPRQIDYWKLISAAGLRRDFSKLSPQQQELISVAALHSFRHKLHQTQLPAKEIANILVPLSSGLVSRIDVSFNDSLFKDGIYSLQDIKEGNPVKYHLDSGGDASLFRGATVSQGDAIMSQTTLRVHYFAISTFGVNVLGLRDAFTCYPDLCEHLFGQRNIALFGEEAETVVPRPLPGKNIEKIKNWNKPELKNPGFQPAHITKIRLEDRALFEALCAANCLVKPN